MPRAQLFLLICGIALSAFILEMVRRRRLREEYSWLWILAAIGYFAVTIFPALGALLSRFIGSSNPVSAFTFIGLFFLFAICVQFSVQISRLTEQIKDLTQQIAILDGEIRTLSAASDGQGIAEQHEVKQQNAQRPDHRSGRLVSGSDQYQSAGESVAKL